MSTKLSTKLVLHVEKKVEPLVAPTVLRRVCISDEKWFSFQPARMRIYHLIIVAIVPFCCQQHTCFLLKHQRTLSLLVRS